MNILTVTNITPQLAKKLKGFLPKWSRIDIPTDLVDRIAVDKPESYLSYLECYIRSFSSVLDVWIGKETCVLATCARDGFTDDLRVFRTVVGKNGLVRSLRQAAVIGEGR